MNHQLVKCLSFAGALCAVVGLSSEAHAEAMTHDGFYLQLNAGLGYLSASDEFDSSMSGVTIPASLLIGGTIGPVALGGGFFGDYAPSPSASFNGNDVDLEDVTMTLIGIGMFADIYPDPNGGLHFQPFVGWGGLERSYRGDSGGSDPTGLVMALGVGYDFWVGNEWSIGPMFRMAYAPLSINESSVDAIAPALLATFTYH
jgi:hypothetical protein